MDITQVLFVVGRVLLGGFFIRSGFNHLRHIGRLKGYAASKGVPAPGVAVFLTGLMLLFGGLGILLGLYVAWSLFLLALFLVVTTFKMHNFWTVADPMARMGESVNFYKNLALLGAVLMLLAVPLPWYWSLGM